MPLLGKIEPGTITELVDSAVQAGQDAILRIEGPQHVGEIQLEAGQVVHASHQHTQLQETLNALCTVEEGEFMLCRGDEHNASSLTPSNVPVWLLDTNEERRTSLTQSLAQKGYSVGMLLHLEDMTALLQESKPSLLLLGEELATEHERALLTSLQQQQHMNVLLVGTPRDISPQLATATKGWLEWPGATEQMESIMRRWTSPHSPAPSPPQSAQTALQLLSHLTPTMDPRAKSSRNYTQCDSLLIGDKCGAHTVPYIEVKNNSSRVEHEATTSKVDDEQLFYCRQRGMDEEEAVALVVNGFCKDVLQALPMEFAMEAQQLVAISLEGSVG